MAEISKGNSCTSVLVMFMLFPLPDGDRLVEGKSILLVYQRVDHSLRTSLFIYSLLPNVTVGLCGRNAFKQVKNGHHL